MSKKKLILYWVLTAWLSLGMLSSALIQLLKVKEEKALFMHLGYPAYFMTLLATWKILGVLVVLLSKLPLLKEWAYAGFFYAMSGALYSHIALGDSFKETFPSVLLLALTIASWSLRPAGRKLIPSPTKSFA